MQNYLHCFCFCTWNHTKEGTCAGQTKSKLAHSFISSLKFILKSVFHLFISFQAQAKQTT